MAPYGSIQGSQSLSRYGDRSIERSYPRYYPRRSCKHREGSTDLSRSSGRDHSRHGQCYLPDKEFRYLRTVHVCYYSPLHLPSRRGRDHFCRALQVALQVGPYHPEIAPSGLAYGL